MKTYAYGLPRLGPNREYKLLLEGFWRKELNQETLINGLTKIQTDNQNCYQAAVDLYPNGEMTLYDFMLDTAILCGIHSPEDLNDYYSLCLGTSALEMNKWFNSNYHYLVTDFSTFKTASVQQNFDHFALKFKQCDFPTLIGPFTFLKLCKGLTQTSFDHMFYKMIEIYSALLKTVDKVQIEEPAFALYLSSQDIGLIKNGYRLLADTGCWMAVIVYYDGVDRMGDILDLPISALGLDFVRGTDNFDFICRHGFPSDRLLLAGMVDGRNVWKNNIANSVEMLARLSRRVKNIAVSNAAPLYHLPVSLEAEDKLAVHLTTGLAFAKEKLDEIRTIAACFKGDQPPPYVYNNIHSHNASVQNKVNALSRGDFTKKTEPAKRRNLQSKLLNLPLFPITTIGSFPQSSDVKSQRAAFNKGKLSKMKYRRLINRQIDNLIDLQEKLGLDVLVHGEFERSDSVEFLAQSLDGIATTENGWVISYGCRVYRPPIIFGDVSRARPMTLDEIQYAQTRTVKPVKGLLTGPVTIIARSFTREDIHVSNLAYQIALALREEIKDYEKLGIKIVQVNEPALREKAPLKKRDWPAYFNWAVKSFNLTTNTDPLTQIHTHMCYSEFGDILEFINQMDYDVISMEASNSKGDVLDFFADIDVNRQIGLGLWDVLSPNIAKVENILDFVTKSSQKIPKENVWINPDCGLRTRNWQEATASLKNLVEAARQLRS